ncbi:MAG: hypothetical protein PUA88_07180 [Bacillales bacterium]|nr:hypothetical protein [Bacillales bacterium]
MIHYVIFASDQDYHKYAYSDLYSESNCEYVVQNNSFKSRILRILYKAHMSPKTNRHFKLPLKKIWFSSMLNFEHTHKNYCFIFFAGTIRFSLVKEGYIDYLKKRFPGSKFVCFYQDLVKFHDNEISIYDVKKHFDYVYSFDQRDCAEYELIYHSLVYSKTYFPKNPIIENDVYFVGLAKNRLTQIIRAFEILTQKGLKCDFHIVGVRKEDRKYEEIIDYCDNVSYSQNLEYISKSKAILEIMQKDGYGFTLRTCEAIMFDKMLITNNCTIENAPFYSTKNVILFDEIESENWEKLKKNSIFIYDYKDKLSPRLFLEEISERIKKDV